MSTSTHPLMPFYAATLRSFAAQLAIQREYLGYVREGVEPPEDFHARRVDARQLNGSIGTALQVVAARQSFERRLREGG